MILVGCLVLSGSVVGYWLGRQHGYGEGWDEAMDRTVALLTKDES